LVVYVQEAHAGDGPAEDAELFAQHDTIEHRRAAACEFVSRAGLMASVLLDNMENSTFRDYGIDAARLYVIDSRGRVAFKSDGSPLKFNPADLTPTLSRLLTD
jgi:hypothetical protein